MCTNTCKDCAMENFKRLQDVYYVYICGNQNIRYMCMCKVHCIIMYEYNKRAK